MTTPPLCFADTETTDIGHRRLAWELAIIRREPDGTQREMQTFIEVDLADANPYALRVGRFHERHPVGRWLANGSVNGIDNALNGFPGPTGGLSVLGPNDEPQSYVSQEDAAALWCRWTHDAVIVGAVPNFDTEVMAEAARYAELLPGHHYHLADVENLAAGYLRGRLAYDTTLTDDDRARLDAISRPSWGSDDLFAALGVTIPDTDRHTALGDARGCMAAWDVLYGTTA